jgi:hypothetical protein
VKNVCKERTSLAAAKSGCNSKSSSAPGPLVTFPRSVDRENRIAMDKNSSFTAACALSAS